MNNRNLIVLRHAKAEPFAATDHDRALSPRGRADAAAAGRWAAEAGWVPDHVVASSSLRTQGTWAEFASAMPATTDCSIDRALYSAGTDGALEIVRLAPDAARTVMLVGHNPTMEQLVHLLEDGSSDPALLSNLSAGYPTAGLAVLEFSQPWHEIEWGTGRLVAFHVARA